MPFHLLAFRTAALASGAANVALGTVPDPMIFSVNNQYQMPKRVNVIASYAGNDAFNDVRINAPSLRSLFLPSLDPFSNTALPANVPPINFYEDMGPEIQFSEGVSVEASRDVVVASEAVALLWVADGRLQKASGPIQTLKCTSATATTAGVWTNGALTLTQNLPVGRYQIVGMSCFGTNVLACRIVFQTGGFRPGVLAQGAVGEWSLDPFRRGGVGVFGEFTNITLPSIDLFCTGVSATQTIFLDIVKVS